MANAERDTVRIFVSKTRPHASPAFALAAVRLKGQRAASLSFRLPWARPARSRRPQFSQESIIVLSGRMAIQELGESK